MFKKNENWTFAVIFSLKINKSVKVFAVLMIKYVLHTGTFLSFVWERIENRKNERERKYAETGSVHTKLGQICGTCCIDH